MIFDAAPRITPFGLFAFILNFYFPRPALPTTSTLLRHNAYKNNRLQRVDK